MANDGDDTIDVYIEIRVVCFLPPDSSEFSDSVLTLLMHKQITTTLCMRILRISFASHDIQVHTANSSGDIAHGPNCANDEIFRLDETADTTNHYGYDARKEEDGGKKCKKQENKKKIRKKTQQQQQRRITKLWRIYTYIGLMRVARMPGRIFGDKKRQKSHLHYQMT